MDFDPNQLRIAAILSVMLTTIGLCCFVWQMLRSGWMFYRVKKPLYGLVFMQTILGVILCLATLAASIAEVDCTVLLIFSVVGVNVSDMALQTVLLWKAYLGNNRNRIILFIGAVPILGLFAFIFANITIARSSSALSEGGVCSTAYPTVIVIIKATIDCSSNTFLSLCFILVIYRHYRVLGSSVHKTLIKEGLIYCFGVCLSNILTGILLTQKVLGGSSPMLYAIDWILTSYLIIKQLKDNRSDGEDGDSEDDDDDVDIHSQATGSEIHGEPKPISFHLSNEVMPEEKRVQ